MVVTDDPALAAALREIREYGWRDRYVSARIGINTRLDPIQAAILAAKLPRLDADNARRQAIAARYDEGLAGLPLDLPPRRPEARHVFHQYVIRTATRDHAARTSARARHRHRHPLSGAGASAAGLSRAASPVPAGSARPTRATRADPQPADVSRNCPTGGGPGNRRNPRLLRLTAAAGERDPDAEREHQQQQQPADQPDRRQRFAAADACRRGS